MSLKYILLILILICAQASFPQGNKTSFIRATPNTYAPTLYSEKVDLQISLVNLPGVNAKGSSFRGSFTIYFIPEGVIENLTRSKGGVIEELRENEISNKVLLASGNFNKSSLNSSRTVERFAIPFKSKVSDKSQTMLGKVLVFYSIKIHDSKLKKSVYKNSSFTYFPFERTDTSVARRTFHLSFFVNDDGQLYTSSSPRDKSSTSW